MSQVLYWVSDIYFDEQIPKIKIVHIDTSTAIIIQITDRAMLDPLLDNFDRKDLRLISYLQGIESTSCHIKTN